MSGIDPPQRPQPGSVPAITPPSMPVNNPITPPAASTAPKAVLDASQIHRVQPVAAGSGGHKAPVDTSVDIDPDKARCKILAAIP